MMSVLSKPSYESNESDNYSLKCFQLLKDKVWSLQSEVSPIASLIFMPTKNKPW